MAIFFVSGATTNCITIFLTPFMKRFGWNHAKVSLVPMAFSLALGLVSPLIGYLLDRLEARLVVCAGAAAAVVGLLIASQSAAISSMVGAYIAMGIGVGAATFIPASLVAANWFKDNRGLAVGVVVAGSSASGIAMPPIADYMIRSFGVTATFFALAVPIAVLVIPAVLLVVRTRPEGAIATSVAEQIKTLPGLEVGPALSTAAFWLLVLVQAFGMAGLGGTFYHIVPALINAGYSPAHAALVMELASGCLGCGLSADGMVGGPFHRPAGAALRAGRARFLGADAAGRVSLSCLGLVAHQLCDRLRGDCGMHLLADAGSRGGNAGAAPLWHIVGSDRVGVYHRRGRRSSAGRRRVRRDQQLCGGV